MEEKELIAFKCMDCKKRIEMGFCGDHKEKTGHKDFQSIYSEKNENQ